MTARCVADSQCRGYDRRARVAAWAEDVLCPGCLHAGQRDVHALTFDYLDLEQVIPRTKRDSELVSGTREQTILIAVGIESIQRAIWLVTTTWERAVRDGYAVQRAVETIEVRLRLLATLPAVVVMPFGPDAPVTALTGAAGILGMMALHAATRSVLGLTRLVNEMPGECPRCEIATLRREDESTQSALRRENGSETVYCANCGNRWTWDEYRRYVELILSRPHP